MRHQDNRHTAGALAAATRFGLKTFEAKKILREVFTAVSGSRTTGKRLRLKAATLDAYASAFSATSQPVGLASECGLGDSRIRPIAGR